MEESIDQLEWLESLGSEGSELKGVAPSLVSEFAKQARAADAGELKRFAAAKRYTLLLSLIYNTRARTRDAVAGMAVKRIATMHQRAKDELLVQQLQQQERVHQLLGKFGEVIDIVATVPSDQLVGQQVRATLTQSGEIELLRREWGALARCQLQAAGFPELELVASRRTNGESCVILGPWQVHAAGYLSPTSKAFSMAST